MTSREIPTLATVVASPMHSRTSTGSRLPMTEVSTCRMNAGRLLWKAVTSGGHGGLCDTDADDVGEGVIDRLDVRLGDGDGDGDGDVE